MQTAILAMTAAVFLGAGTTAGNDGGAPGAWTLGPGQVASAEAPPTQEDNATARRVDVVSALASTLSPAALQDLVREVLDRNPEVARLRREARAAGNVPPQVRARPDPMLAIAFLALPPETRVGPQRLQTAITQTFPWFGKLDLREQSALWAATALEANVEAARLHVLTEARRLFYELAFLAELEAILHEEREVLLRQQEAALARYSAGVGLQQEVVRLQAQTTRIETRLLDVRERTRTLLALLNALRDRASSTAVEGLALPFPLEPQLEGNELRQSALARRPELAAVDAQIAARASLVELARKNYSPDLTLGVSYTFVGARTDAAGVTMPPPDNGSDVLAFGAALNLPIRREKLAAGLEEALERRRAEEERRRLLLAAIENEIGDPASRLPIIHDQWELLEGVLRLQAEEALRSAEAAYTTGRLNAVDLLDAEVMLFEVRASAARARADFAIAWVQLERAAARNLDLVREADGQ